MTDEQILAAVDNIPSSVYEPEMKMWHKYLAPLDKPLIVDFGTGWGKSAIALALANDTGTVHTFDIGDVYVNQHAHYGDWEVNNHEDYERVVRNYIAEKGLTDRVIFTVESSETRPLIANIDVLNIDSNHTYEGTFKEINIWVPEVKKGGLVFFHDYDHPKAPGVSQAINELIPSKYNLELLEVSEAMGPGIKCAAFKVL